MSFHFKKSSKINLKSIIGKSGMKMKFIHQLGRIEQGIHWWVYYLGLYLVKKWLEILGEGKGKGFLEVATENGEENELTLVSSPIVRPYVRTAGECFHLTLLTIILQCSRNFHNITNNIWQSKNPNCYPST